LQNKDFALANGISSFSAPSPQIIENHTLSAEELPDTVVKY
jgi:hypothetical protein